MNAHQVTYSKVTVQRGKQRIWLQGLRLSACGFDKGMRYRIDYDMDSGVMHVVLDANGSRVVSGRKRAFGYEPIIDICNADVMTLTKGAKRVRADFYDGRIEFSISHTEVKKQAREARFLDELAGGVVSTGTLCCGGGMATLATHDGFARNGLRAEARWVVDREQKYLAAACLNNSAITDKTKIFEASLEELEPELLEPVSIMQVSLPCTGHSLSGRSKNKIKNAESHATDATAVWGLMNIVNHVQPSCLISENVTQARTSATYTLIKGMLTFMGYRIHEFELGPEMSGAFEARRRYWFVAVSSGLGELDVATLPRFRRQYGFFAELMEPVADESPSWSENTYLKEKSIRDAAAGKGFAKRQLITPETTSIGVAGRTYQKKQSTAPMVTRDDGKERLLTPLELCRAHGAPESLIKNLSAATAFELLGQGVDHFQAVGIGQMIAASYGYPSAETVSPLRATNPARVKANEAPDEDDDVEETTQYRLFG